MLRIRICFVIGSRHNSHEGKAYDLRDDGEKPIGCVSTASSVKSYRTMAGGL